MTEMELADLRETEWTFLERPDGRLEISSVRQEISAQRVVQLFLYIPGTFLSIAVLGAMVGPSFPVGFLLGVAALGWLALIPWARRRMQEGERLLASPEGAEVVGYQHDKIVRQGWVLPQRVEVRRKTILRSVGSGDDRRTVPADAWSVVGVAEQGEAELLWAQEKDRVEMAARRLREALKLETPEGQSEESRPASTSGQSGGAPPQSFEDLLPVPAAYFGRASVSADEVAFVTRTFHSPKRHNASLVVLAVGALAGYATFQAASQLVMLPILFFFLLSVAVCGPQLRERTLFRRDGIVLEDHLGQPRRHLAWSDIVSVESDGTCLVARPREGKPLLVLNGPRKGLGDWPCSIVEYASGQKVKAPKKTRATAV